MPRRARDADPIEEIKNRLRRLLDSRDYDEIEGLLAALGERSASDDEIGIVNAAGERAGRPRELTKPRRFGAEDAALALDAAPSSAAGQRALRVAIERVAPFVGRDEVLAQDSAEAVYRRALVLLGVSPRDLHAHALPFVFDATVKQSGAGRREPMHGGLPAPSPHLAADGIGESNLPASVRKALAGVRSLG
ncbi:MAG: hypothetical protein M0Z28_29035 [Rhodospirillales bacterium]|nr:hypothetical protein [Rhodospirillales bacterium]